MLGPVCQNHQLKTLKLVLMEQTLSSLSRDHNDLAEWLKGLSTPQPIYVPDKPGLLFLPSIFPNKRCCTVKVKSILLNYPIPFYLFRYTTAKIQTKANETNLCQHINTPVHTQLDDCLSVGLSQNICQKKSLSSLQNHKEDS